MRTAARPTLSVTSHAPPANTAEVIVYVRDSHRSPADGIGPLEVTQALDRRAEQRHQDQGAVLIHKQPAIAGSVAFRPHLAEPRKQRTDLAQVLQSLHVRITERTRVMRPSSSRITGGTYPSEDEPTDFAAAACFSSGNSFRRLSQ